MKIKTFGSVCSGIETASLVLKPQGVKPLWLSEIDEYPCRFLAENYAESPNLGDMNDVPSMIRENKVGIPDLLCGGTPCQAFSLAGWREGVNDDRGQLTLKFFDILDRIDEKRLSDGKERAVCFWENVEGVLTDGNNAFGCFLAGLAGLEEPLRLPVGQRAKKTPAAGSDPLRTASKWPEAGVLLGKERNIAWRVLDAKYFGLPQQRRRIYVVAGGKDFHPQDVLFETGGKFADPYKAGSDRMPGIVGNLFGDETASPRNFQIDTSLKRTINGHEIEVFRTYSDCLYAAYGTKWNGNAAAFNGSLFISQDGRLRRFTPLEAERIMGFPDNYTRMKKCRDTQRYRAAGNAWAVNVVKWITERLCSNESLKPVDLPANASVSTNEYSLYLLKDFVPSENGRFINATAMPYEIRTANILDFVDTEAEEKFYISPAGCAGILRRKMEHNSGMNARLEIVLRNCSGERLQKAN